MAHISTIIHQFLRGINPPKPIIGLDINHEAVRLVVLGRKGSQYTLFHADAESLPSGVDYRGGNTDNGAVAQTIRTLLDRSRIRIKSAAIALPVNSVIVKIIALPSDLDEMGITEQIRYEGSQYIPLSMDVVNFDFSVMGPDENRHGYQSVLLVAAKKEDVEDRSAMLEEAGLKPKLIDVESFALWGVYRQNKTPEKDVCVTFVDIGEDETHVYAFQNDQPIYTKDHHFGLSALIENIQNQYNLSAIDAKRMELFGGLPTEYEKEVRRPFVEKTAKEIIRALDFFHASLSDVDISEVVLTGMGARTEGLTQAIIALPTHLKLSVSVMDPFEGMSISSKINRKFLEAEKYGMAIACGLALRRFG